jgi:membrane associated rhomboid family serine protease
MIVPYRCKNLPEQFPTATISLIAVNVIVYLFTTNFLIDVKAGILIDYAVWPGHCNPLRLLISMFLHEQLFHLLINMWFLWLFGTAVEGRVGIPKFLLVYFVCGIGGGLLECGFESMIHSFAPVFGSDGAVMGMAGAYMYIFPFARIMVFRFIIIWPANFYIGPAEWLAWWVVLFYVGADAFNGVLGTMMGAFDFFGFAAHASGMAIGFFAALALRPRRDSEMISQAQAVRADLGADIDLLSVSEMESILEAPTEDMHLVTTYCDKAMLQQGERGDRNALAMIERYKQQLLVRADPAELSALVLRIPKEIGGISGPFYLRLGGRLEQLHQYETAAYIYRRAYDIYQTTQDAGAALMRLARLWELVFFDLNLSQEGYTVYIENFPSGPLIEEAKKGLERVNNALAGDKTGRLPSLQNNLKETTFMLHAEEPADTAKPGRIVARPDLSESTPIKADSSNKSRPNL